MEHLCRGCLSQFSDIAELSQYSEKNRRLFVYATGLQVKRNDGFTFHLCPSCCCTMKASCKFKKQCRASDKTYKNYLLTKEEGDGDFGQYVKSMDDNPVLRLPESTEQSTPAYQKNKDDDNESTCTSICNFMSDMLGEGMPTDRPLPRIIREVIEEEADLCDDSLDSLWLHDDPSSDYNIDYSSFSPFATPRAFRGELYSSPLKLEDFRIRENNVSTKKIEIDRPHAPYHMPSLEVNIKEEDDFNEDIPSLPLDSSIPSEVEDLVTENSISSKLQSFQTDLIQKQMNYDNEMLQTLSVKSEELNDLVDHEMCIVLNQGVAIKKENLDNELENYVNKVEMKKITRNLSKEDKSKDTIDRNLEIALKITGGAQFALDQILESPQVSNRSCASTPTLKNILFGDNNKNDKDDPVSASTPLINKILFGKNLSMENAPKYFPQVGQSIETDDDSQAGSLLEEFIGIHRRHGVKDEIEDMECTTTKEMGNFSIRSEERNEVLDRFLNDSDGPMPDGDVISLFDQSIDSSDKEVFKKPLTPDEIYDLHKCICIICNKSYKTPKSLKIHLTKCHRYTIRSLDPHGNKNRQEKEHVCDVCSKLVKGTANFIRHRKTHEKSDDPQRIFQCDLCKFIFCSRNGIQSHLLRVHKGILKTKHSKKFACSHCGKLSGNLTHLKLHELRHTGEFKMSCSICEKGFYRDYDLKLHMRSHNGLRPFACQHCPKKYKRRDTLYKHMMQHLGKYNYKCDFCDDGFFVTESSLAKHHKSTKCINNRFRKCNNTVEMDYQSSFERIQPHFLDQSNSYDANESSSEAQLNDQSENIITQDINNGQSVNETTESEIQNNETTA